MRKKLGLLCVLVLALALVCSACGGAVDQTQSEKFSYDDGISSSGNYDKTHFYQNDLDTAWSADPFVIYITEGEDKGYFYAYATGSGYTGLGFVTYRSKDLSSWEAMGMALQLDSVDGWATGGFWAPEVIYIDGLYYMWYSASQKNVNNGVGLYVGQHISVAVSESPKGPFTEYVSSTPNVYNETFDGSRPVIRFEDHAQELQNAKIEGIADFDAAIDPHPFIDDDGTYYMLFSCQGGGTYGMRMNDDLVTPDYSSVTPLLYAGYSKVSYDSEKQIYTVPSKKDIESESTVNEGPFVEKHTTKKPKSGGGYEYVTKYYLTYSAPGYRNPFYSVHTAVADDPLGPYTKLVSLTNEKPMHGIDDTWNHMSGTGHHSIVNAGDEKFIFYHAFLDRDHGSLNPRALAADRLTWSYSEELGYDVYHSNGPTYSLNPLPNVTSGKKNLMLLNGTSVTATNVKDNKSANLLKDNIIPLHSYSDNLELRVDGSTTITINFDKAYSVSSLFIYNSYLFDYAFGGVKKVTITDENSKTYVVNNLAFNSEYYIADGDFPFIRPASASVMAFDAIKTKRITIQIDSKIDSSADSVIGIGEIVVIGK